MAQSPVTQAGHRMQLGEALALFSEHLEDIQQAQASNLSASIRELKAEKPTPTGNAHLDWIRDEVYQCRMRMVAEPRRRVLKRITDRIAYERNPGKFQGRVTDEDIARAKEYPLEELYDGDLKGTQRAKMGCCPFHHERTPSFHIRPDNTYTCYGCSVYGDVIDFYQRLHDVDFLTAVRALNK